MPKFRGAEDPELSDAMMLPEDEREALCLSLLDEFGAGNIRITHSKSGIELIHSCVLPFGGHKNGDRHPSASLNASKLVFVCWGCGNAGSLFWFIGACRGTNDAQTREWVQSKAGDQGIGTLMTYLDSVYNSDTRPPPDVIPRMDPRILSVWAYRHPYLQEIRGVPMANCERFQVGWDPKSDRIVLPHFWQGDLVGWQTRRLASDGTAKYISSVDMPKRSTVFNYQPGSEVVVVEAPMTVVAREHLHHMEATFGALVTEKQVLRLGFHSRIILFFDNDEAGWKATERVGGALWQATDVLVADNRFAADPADMHPATLRAAIEGAVEFGLWSRPKTVVERCPECAYDFNQVEHRACVLAALEVEPSGIA